MQIRGDDMPDDAARCSLPSPGPGRPRAAARGPTDRTRPGFRLSYALRLWLGLLIGLPAGAWSTAARSETFSIAASSMAPALVIGDIFFADSIRDPVPKLFRRGEIIIFRRNDTDTTGWVKRVIGLPGDRVQMRQGRLHLNGQPVSREFIGRHEVDETGRRTVMQRYRETLPGDDVSFDVLEQDDGQPFDNTPEYRVPEGQLFVLGDHRDNSLDSRAMTSFGFVLMTRVFAQPRFIIWSRDLSRIGTRFD
ncbi:signal peptidase I [Roseomonas sp. F4]